MNFVIDQGNTFAKLALFEGDKMLGFDVSEEINNKKIISFISSSTIKSGIIASL